MTNILLATVLSAAPVAAPAPASVPTNSLAVSAPAAAADAPEVGVPFACGLSFPVSQAHNTGSHLNYDTYAWDFRMPEGTPIVAADDGVVRMARGDSTVGGCDVRFAPFANYVVVDHPNGRETQYLHFEKVVVQPGQKVHKGELLGYSGATGWACGAHLHFKVAEPRTTGWNNPSMPARIAGYGDPERGTLIVAPSCKTGPNVILAEGSKPAEVKPADGTAAAPRVQTAGGKVAEVVGAVQDAAATAATAVMPGSQSKR